MTRAHSLAEQANNNVWLGLAQKAVTLVLVPLLLTAFWTIGNSYMALRDRQAQTEGDLRGALQRVASLESISAALRLDLTAHASSITRLQAQREGDIQLGRRVDELRDELREGNARVNARLDAMMTPPQRVRP